MRRRWVDRQLEAETVTIRYKTHPTENATLHNSYIEKDQKNGTTKFERNRKL